MKMAILSVLSLMALFFFGNKIVEKSKKPLKYLLPVSQDRLYKDVEALVNVHPARNYKNLASLNQVADYISEQFKLMGADFEFQEYQVNGETYKNVLASYGDPLAKKRIVVGAHYDVCGDQAGADDNASAVAGMLEIARLMFLKKPDLKYRVDFVAYSLEEPPFFNTEYMGSAVHARSLKQAEVDVELMVCLEMIGYFSDEPNSQEFPVSFLKWFYPTTGNFIAVIGKMGQGGKVRKFKKLMKRIAKIDVQSITAPTILPGIDFSDHRNYWAEGYPAVMINNTAFYRNKNYHEKSDNIESLNFDKMAEVVGSVYYAIVKWN